MKTMAVAEFKARCLRVVEQMNSDREPGNYYESWPAGCLALTYSSCR